MDNYKLKKIFQEIEGANDLANKEIFAVSCMTKITNRELGITLDYTDGEFSSYVQFVKYMQEEYASDYAHVITTATYRRFDNTFVCVDFKTGLGVQLRLIKKG